MEQFKYEPLTEEEKRIIGLFDGFYVGLIHTVHAKNGKFQYFYPFATWDSKNKVFNILTHSDLQRMFGGESFFNILIDGNLQGISELDSWILLDLNDSKYPLLHSDDHHKEMTPYTVASSLPYKEPWEEGLYYSNPRVTQDNRTFLDDYNWIYYNKNNSFVKYYYDKKYFKIFSREDVEKITITLNTRAQKYTFSNYFQKDSPIEFFYIKLGKQAIDSNLTSINDEDLIQSLRYELPNYVYKNLTSKNVEKILIDFTPDFLLYLPSAMYLVMINRIKNIFLINECTVIYQEKQKLEHECKKLEDREKNLKLWGNNFAKDFENALDNKSEIIARLTFDGVLAQKIQQAASIKNTQDKNNAYKRLINEISSIDPFQFNTSDKLIDYIVREIKKKRDYPDDFIVNLMICITQGFLTVFSGAPGTGKTSICDIIGKVLGLDQFKDRIGDTRENINVNRYLNVSVERGWTSKRDFIGYYNALTDSFEANNSEVYDGMRILDQEARHGINEYPYLILLDEANLSQMEYYWADFMNICDGHKNTIDMGHKEILQIPKTLRFLATINNDYTTEALSPRLIDRSWIITLPDSKYVKSSEMLDSHLVNYGALKDTFDVSDKKRSDLEKHPVNDKYKNLKKEIRELESLNMYISKRNEEDILNYLAVAVNYMHENVALDYVVKQKILPKINGSGEAYSKALEDFKGVLKKCGLTKSQEDLEKIINKGNNEQHMQSYQFFE